MALILVVRGLVGVEGSVGEREKRVVAVRGREREERRMRRRRRVVEVNGGVGERGEFDVVPDMFNGRRRRRRRRRKE